MGEPGDDAALRKVGQPSGQCEVLHGTVVVRLEGGSAVHTLGAPLTVAHPAFGTPQVFTLGDFRVGITLRTSPALIQTAYKQERSDTNDGNPKEGSQEAGDDAKGHQCQANRGEGRQCETLPPVPSSK